VRQHTWKRFHGARGHSGIGETNGSIFCGRAGEFDPLSHRSARNFTVEAFLVSLSTVAIAEIGDRTQLLSLVLATRYRKHWPIIAGILLATLANHAMAGIIGAAFGKFLSPTILDGAVGASMLGMAVWALIPDKLDHSTRASEAGAFVTTLIAFFFAEMGDKTRIATMALAAEYHSLIEVVSGTTVGMMIANIPVVVAGNAFSERLPMRAIHYLASGLFAILGAVFIVRAILH
jgi:putative Ca2+/H+ antiporter (TMEM165/GDT1 family)